MHLRKIKKIGWWLCKFLWVISLVIVWLFPQNINSGTHYGFSYKIEKPSHFSIALGRHHYDPERYYINHYGKYSKRLNYKAEDWMGVY